MSSSYLATDYITPHDIYLELLELTQVPNSAFGGRPNIFAVVSLERALSAPKTVAPRSSGNDDHEHHNNVDDAANVFVSASAVSTSAGSAVSQQGQGAAAVSSHSSAATAAVPMSYAMFTAGSSKAAVLSSCGKDVGSFEGLSEGALLPSSMQHGIARAGEGRGSRPSCVGSPPTIRVGRTNIISDAPVVCNMETKLCISHCHDREVIRITLYDHVESPRGFLGTVIFPVGGPLREYGSRVMVLEGPMNTTLRVSWEMVDSTSAKGQRLVSTFAAAMEGRIVEGLSTSANAYMHTLKARAEAEWRDKYGSSMQHVSAAAVGGTAASDQRAGAASTAAVYEGAASILKADNAKRNGADTVGNAISMPAPLSADQLSTKATTAAGADGSTTCTAISSAVGGMPITTTTTTSREAHLENRVRMLEDALLAVAKNKDDLVQRELLRRVAGGEVNVMPASPSPLSAAATKSKANNDNLMALTVKDLTNVASQGHGTLSHAIAQAAAKEQLASILGVEAGQIAINIRGLGHEDGGVEGDPASPSSPNAFLLSESPLASTTVAALRAAREREKAEKTAYHNPQLMKNVAPQEGQRPDASGPSSPNERRLVCDDKTYPNLADLIANPCRPLTAEEDTLLKAYRGPRALYESDRTQLAASNSVLFGAKISFPSLMPHHGHAMEASYVLGTDSITRGMEHGLPPMLATAAVSSSMPVSFAKNSLKFRRPLTDVALSSTTSSPSSALTSPTAGRRGPLGYLSGDTVSRPSSSLSSKSLRGEMAFKTFVASNNNTVLNDIAVASMYPASTPISAADPHFRDNTEAWKRALAHKDLHMAAEGDRVVRPY